MADEPLLNLNTLVKRETIEIDGTRYELFSADELSVLTTHRFTIWGRRIEQLRDSTDPLDGVEYDDLIDQIASAAVVDLPAAVLEQLGGADKLAIVDVFTGLLLRKRLVAVGAMARAAGLPSTGEKPSPDSSDTTADRPDGGWLKRLGRWFGRI
jgi:hypothetical protein